MTTTQELYDRLCSVLRDIPTEIRISEDNIAVVYLYPSMQCLPIKKLFMEFEHSSMIVENGFIAIGVTD